MRRGAVISLVLLAISTSACDRVDNPAHVEGIRRVVTATRPWIDRTTAVGRRMWTIERTF